MIKHNDLVKTSYNSGPYRVLKVIHSSALARCCMAWIVRDYPVFSLVCADPREKSQKKAAEGHAYLNDIRVVEGDTSHIRYITDVGDEIFVVGELGQSLLFDSPDQRQKWRPHNFQEGVDYELGRMANVKGMPGLHIKRREWELYHCEICQLNFNPNGRPAGFGGVFIPCPKCGLATDPLIVRTLASLDNFVAHKMKITVDTKRPASQQT